MNWLLWREYRLNRLILITGAVLLMLPYLTLGFEVLFEGANPRPDFEGVVILSLLFSWLTVSLLAGNSIAGERADRSAEFIAYLPLPRWRTLVSKLVLFLITVAMIYGASILAALVFVGPAELFAFRFPKVLSFAAFFAINFVVTYGVGWLFSSLQSSPILANVAGFAAGIFATGCAWGVVWMSMEEPSKYVPNPLESMVVNAFAWNTMIGFPLAIVCFCIGTWNYLRSSEPLTGSTS
jgi:ABC-type transport system involved in multi-copper enzyme maturation permease subunit